MIFIVMLYRKKMMRQSCFLLVIGLVLLSPAVCLSRGTSTPVVLVTGFEPFGNYTENPSELIAESLNGSCIGNVTIIGIVLPVDFNNSLERATHAIEQYHPILVISTGLNANTHRINVEKIGYNIKRYQKENGQWSFPRRIDTTGPWIRISPLHTNDIVRDIRNANISVQQSFFTGTYVCNSLFYQLLGYVTTHHLNIPVGFIHVPLLDTQDPSGMPLQQMVTAVHIAVETSLG
jgi:pyroglutamyl-peptidase